MSRAFACARCAAEVVSNRLPRGWKDYGGPICGACLAADYCVRAISLPVARVVGRLDARGDDVEFTEGFLRHFHPAWRAATDLANWAIRELARRDVRRTPEMETLPKYDPAAMFGTFKRRLKRKGADPKAPQVGTLYSLWNDQSVMPLAWRQLWDGATGSALTVLTAVEDAWKGHKSFGRLAVLWQGKARPMVFGYPYPFPIRAGDWWAGWHDDPGGRIPRVAVPLLGGRYLLELDRSPELKWQLRDFDALVTGAARGADLKLVPVSRGGRVVGVKAIIAGRFPRTPAPQQTERVATVTTGAENLITVEVPDRDPFVISGDQVRGAVYGHTRWLARYRNDMKHEKRWPARKRRRMVAGGAAAHIERQHGRIDSELKQIAAAVVGFARRQRCGVLVYRDAERSFVPSLPWHALRERLRCLCNEEGLAFQHDASEADAGESEA